MSPIDTSAPRRRDLDFARSPGPTGAAPLSQRRVGVSAEDAAPRDVTPTPAPERARAAWAERPSADDAGVTRVRTELRPGAAGRGARARSIGVGDAAAPGAAVPGTGGARPEVARPAAGSTVAGVRYQPGIQQVPADVAARGDAATTRALLDQAVAHTGNDPQLRFQIGRETLTAGQLRHELDRNPARFADWLQASGVSMAELNEALDDILASNPAAGSTFDLREGSELARASRGGGADGAVVDLHLDASRTERRAAGLRSAEGRVDLSNERVEGPSVWQQIVDALEEAVAAIARLFGSSWNPDTVTFDGRVDDAHFREVGRDMVRGEQGAMIATLMSTEGGSERLRASLLAQRPQSATEAQWSRAVDRVMEGIGGEVRGGRDAGRFADLGPAEAERALVYMRSQDFSAQSRADVALVAAQPQPIRGQALQLLTELPEAERANMLSLFTAPGELPDDASTEQYRAHEAASVYQRADGPARAAMFETLRRDGFRHRLDAPEMQDLTQAVSQSRDLPPALRDRYLATLPRLGLERAHLAGDYERGLAAQMRERPNDAAALLGDFEGRIGSTRDLERTLGAGALRLRLVEPNGGLITSAADRSRVVDALEAHNVRFTLRPEGGGDPLTFSTRGGAGPNDISIQRYLSDTGYRSDVLARTGMRREAFEGMLRNVAGSLRAEGQAGDRASTERSIARLEAEIANPETTQERRTEATQELRRARLELEAQRSPSNVDIDISRGSRVNQLFGLSESGGPSAQLQLAREHILHNQGADFEVRIREPGRGGQVHTISQEAMAEILESADPEAAFRARFGRLDYQETVMAFSRLTEMYWNGQLPEPADGGTTRLDFTRSIRGNAPLERVRSQLTDGVRGNVAPGTLETTVGARSTTTQSDPTLLTTDSRVGAASGNNWWQYGIFHMPGGYSSTRWANDQAQAAFLANGSRPDPAIPMGAILGLDDFARTEVADGGTSYRQLGITHGRLDDFLTDPRTGARSEGRDIQVVSFTGRGSARERPAFDNTVERVRGMFTRFGGVPQAQTEVHRDVSPERMQRAIEAEILRDPRPAGERTDAAGRERPRTVVVHLAGHTVSHSTHDAVLGFMVTGADGQRTWFTPQQIEELNRTAREQGVNLVWVADACRGGEYVDAARRGQQAEVDAAGALPADVRSLTGLRTGLRLQHQVLTAVHNRGRQPAPMPGSEALARMGAEALQGGPGSPAMQRLIELRDRVANTPGMSEDNKALMRLYVESVEAIMQNRSDLAGVAGLDPQILNHGLVTGDTTWRAGRVFKTHTAGPLADAIGSELRTRSPAPVVTPRDEPR